MARGLQIGGWAFYAEDIVAVRQGKGRVSDQHVEDEDVIDVHLRGGPCMRFHGEDLKVARRELTVAGWIPSAAQAPNPR